MLLNLHKRVWRMQWHIVSLYEAPIWYAGRDGFSAMWALLRFRFVD
jgi:hypothetical protein